MRLSTGRRAVHDEETREALLSAATALLQAAGRSAVTTRAVAREAATTTRAVYALFGSQHALLDEVAARASAGLLGALMRVPISNDPLDDLVRVGADGYRGFARADAGLHDAVVGSDAALFAPRVLEFVGSRARRAGLLRAEAGAPLFACQFLAVCSGLAAAERAAASAGVDPGALWTATLEAFVRGLPRTGGVPQGRFAPVKGAGL